MNRAIRAALRATSSGIEYWMSLNVIARQTSVFRMPLGNLSCRTRERIIMSWKLCRERRLRLETFAVDMTGKEVEMKEGAVCSVYLSCCWYGFLERENRQE